MLDNITKKRIDDCRDVLVGKVPDPKSQIEQITLALIYKFMDDMDKEAVETFGGKAKFFAPPVYTGDTEIDNKLIDYSKYSWRKLFDASLSGAVMLALYMDALEKLNINPNVPELFRNIFKNAYLPYRDPITLKLFLKYIDEFSYTHSEKLGDAFEYLLSVMGSQGDAGQFRTPRHIIDFVTACINPQKNETVLDPACGTAGFLLSAYKHIYLQNTNASTTHKNIYDYSNTNKEAEIERLGTALTPDQRKKVLTNFVGYDISPDMVRLSLANMYLHGFTTPQIHEYDSLSSEDRWNETYDVILANPPFMTPKGGIRPHKKFGVQANKAEVLFTDYIAEHLNPNGRAGIVVPNGIVATSQTAYKELRKHLVTDSLIAVISLPAGVFQPYSGVKTSVLILDKRLAKKSQHILFLKIENDGFDLGAQRREIDKNDLPLALQTLQAYKACLSNDMAFEFENNLSVQIKKETILESRDIVLSSDRYLDRADFSTEYNKVKLVEVLDYEQPTKYIVESENYDNSYKIPVLTAGKSFILGYTNETKGIFNEELPVIIFDDFTTATKLVDFHFKVKSSAMKILKAKKEIADIRYLYYVIQDIEFDASEHKRYWISQYSQLQIPLPPLEIQQQIVAEIEGYQKIIDGAKQIVNNYKPSININPNWEMVEFGEVAKIKGGFAFKSEDFVESGIQVLKISNVTTGNLVLNKNPSFIELHKKNDYIKYLIKQKDILITMTGTEGKRDYGDVCFVTENGEFLLNQRVGKVEIFSDLINRKYLSYAMRSPIYQDEIFKKATGVRQSNVSASDLEEIKIPLPPIEEQQAIVQQIEAEQALVNGNKQLMALFQQKIKTKINQVWGVSPQQPKPYTLPEPQLNIAAEV